MRDATIIDGYTEDQGQMTLHMMNSALERYQTAYSNGNTYSYVMANERFVWGDTVEANTANPVQNPTPTPTPTPTPNPTPNPPNPNPGSLTKANIAVGTNSVYALNITVPANSPATSLLVYANNRLIKTVHLTPNQTEAKTIVLHSTSAAAGNFTYRCELKAANGTASSESLTISLTSGKASYGGNAEKIM